jgi:hypothetical protein
MLTQPAQAYLGRPLLPSQSIRHPRSLHVRSLSSTPSCASFYPIASQILGVFMGYCGAHLLFHHRHRFVRLRASCLSCSIVRCSIVRIQLSFSLRCYIVLLSACFQLVLSDSHLPFPCYSILNFYPLPSHCNYFIHSPLSGPMTAFYLYFAITKHEFSLGTWRQRIIEVNCFLP